MLTSLGAWQLQADIRLGRGVQVDNRMRAWYTKDMSCGLLYSCVLGNVRPDCPVALINNRLQDGSEVMEVIPMEHQLPAQRQQVTQGLGIVADQWVILMSVPQKRTHMSYRKHAGCLLVWSTVIARKKRNRKEIQGKAAADVKCGRKEKP